MIYQNDDYDFKNSYLHSIDASSLDMLDWISNCSAYAFACQNTLKDYQIFIKIKLEDLYYGKHQSSPNVKALIDRFNSLSSFVATTILRSTDRKQRSSILSKHIQIIEVCY